jgi:hypothetical protein
MRKWIGLFALLVVVAACVIFLGPRLFPSSREQRFERVDLGMSEEEVLAIMGKPEGIMQIGNGNSSLACWGTDQDEFMYYVAFDETKKVWKKQRSLPKLPNLYSP